MSVNVNVGGVWKSVVSFYVNVGGVWKPVWPYVNVGGVWKQISVSSAGVDHGYMACGMNTSSIINGVVSKISYITDTSSMCPSLSFGMIYPAGVSADTKGYIMGGSYNSNFYANTFKMIYSTDINSLQTSAYLSQGRYKSVGISADVKGYVIGGKSCVNNFVATADKITYSTDTTVAQPSAYQPYPILESAGISADIKGYVIGSGGIVYDVIVSESFKVTYSTDITEVQTSAKLSTPRFLLSGVSAETKGYLMGGYAKDFLATTDKITYATDTTAAQTSANLSVARYGLAGVSADTKGYALFGASYSSYTAADIVNFITDITYNIPLTGGYVNNYAVGISGYNQASKNLYYIP